MTERDLTFIKELIRKDNPDIVIPDSLQFYPGYHHRGGIVGDRCVSCHKILGHGAIVVKEPNWEHYKCWGERTGRR